jgi:hypothetical protein
MAHAVAVGSRQQQYVAEETQGEAEVQRNSIRKNAITMQNLPEDREENEELLRAMNALERAEMIPIETAEERS